MTGNAVYVQLVPNTRRWIPGVVIERVSVTIIQNKNYQRWNLFQKQKIYQDQAHRLKAKSTDYTREQDTKLQQYTHRKTTETDRIHELYQNIGHTKKICIKHSIVSSAIQMVYVHICILY